jgi:hypothetical protein
MVLNCRETKKPTTSSWRLGWRTEWMEIDLDEKFYDRLKKSSRKSPSLWSCGASPLDPQRLLENMDPRRFAEIGGLKTARRLSNHLSKPCLPTRISFTPLQDTTAQIRLACLHPWHSLGRFRVLRGRTLTRENGLYHSRLSKQNCGALDL